MRFNILTKLIRFKHYVARLQIACISQSRGKFRRLLKEINSDDFKQIDYV
jgi:hypothetical protein